MLPTSASWKSDHYHGPQGPDVEQAAVGFAHLQADISPPGAIGDLQRVDLLVGQFGIVADDPHPGSQVANRRGLQRGLLRCLGDRRNSLAFA